MSPLLGQDTIHSDFGESWQEPEGIVWGDVAKNSDGTIRLFENRYEALKYCNERNARLPNREDFDRLRSYMGFLQDSYNPQILPNLTREENGVTKAQIAWSYTTYPQYNYAAYAFNGLNANFHLYDQQDPVKLKDAKLVVRCVSGKGDYGP